MLKIAICDDISKELEIIFTLTSEYASAHGMMVDIGTYTSADELLKALEGGIVFDAMLLDICMPGLSGIDLVRELHSEKISCPIIFLTTSKEYALEAFGVYALRYILKPINKAQFDEAMDFLTKLLYDKAQRNVIVKTEDGIRQLCVDEILFCEADRKYAQFHLKSEVVRVYGTLEKQKEMLTKFPDFKQLGASYLVNLAHVSKFSSKTITIENGCVLPIPRRVYADFHKAYKEFYFKED